MLNKIISYAFQSVLVTLAIATLAQPADASERRNVGATRDTECRLEMTEFTIPEGKSASNFNYKLNSSWLPCSGAVLPKKMGFRVLSGSGNVLFHYVRYNNNQSEVLVGDLSTLILKPGTYKIDVDGGKSTKVSLYYDLGDKGSDQLSDSGIIDISGRWSDPATKSLATIVQDKNSISMTNSFIWEGKNVEWIGVGSINGRNINFSYTYTKNKPAAWENGTMNLNLIGTDKLAGRWISYSDKYSQKISFKKRSAEDELEEEIANTLPDDDLEKEATDTEPSEDLEIEIANTLSEETPKPVPQPKKTKKKKRR